jgi:hypothetical protein
MVCLAAFGHLSHLTDLYLGGAQGLTRQGFMLLLAAPRLRTMQLTFNEQVPESWVREQVAVVAQRRREGRSRVV